MRGQNRAPYEKLYRLQIYKQFGFAGNLAGADEARGTGLGRNYVETTITIPRSGSHD
jgi:hypothetical protein